MGSANPTTRGVYVAFLPTPGRVEKGAHVAKCERCARWIGHWPKDSAGYELVCGRCADDIGAIRKHLDQLAKARGE